MSQVWNSHEEEIREEWQTHFQGLSWLLMSIPSNLMYLLFFDSFTIRIWSCSQFFKRHVMNSVSGSQRIAAKVIDSVQSRRKCIRYVVVISLGVNIITRSLFQWKSSINELFSMGRTARAVMLIVLLATWIIFIGMIGYLFLNFVFTAREYQHSIKLIQEDQRVRGGCLSRAKSRCILIMLILLNLLSGGLQLALLGVIFYH